MRKKNSALCKISLLSLLVAASISSPIAFAKDESPPPAATPGAVADNLCIMPTPAIAPAFKMWLERNSKLPLLHWQPYRFAKNEKVIVTFWLDKFGNMDEPKFERSAWDIDTDASCLEACLTSSAFKPMPEGFRAPSPPDINPDERTLFQAVFNYPQMKDWFTGAVDYYKQNPDKAKTTFALHAVPLFVTEAYPQTFTRAELSGIDNVVTIPKNRDTYEADIKIYCGCWQQFFLQHATASRQEILQLRDTLKKDLPRMLIPQPQKPILTPQP